MKTYISLPISGRDIEEARAEAERMKDFAIDLFHEAGEEHQVITPFDVVPDPPDLPPTQQYAYCMERDIEALLQCDQILMCLGWQHSRGCRAEYELAKIYGIPITYVDFHIVTNEERKRIKSRRRL